MRRSGSLGPALLERRAGGGLPSACRICPTDRGTAVTVQAMVFGNMGATSGSGVGFTPRPGHRSQRALSRHLPGRQGEDIVAGPSRRGRPRTASSQPSPGWSAAPGDASDTPWRTSSATPRTSSSPSRTENSGYCRPERPNAPRGPPSKSPVTSSTKQLHRPIHSPGTDCAPTTWTSITRTRLGSPSRKPRPSAAPPPPAPASPPAASPWHPDTARHTPNTGPTHHPGTRRGLHRRRRTPSPRARGLLTATRARTCHAAVVAHQLGIVCLVNCTSLGIDLGSRS